jgi:DNA-binding response OmpR family regulator
MNRRAPRAFVGLPPSPADPPRYPPRIAPLLVRAGRPKRSTRAGFLPAPPSLTAKAQSPYDGLKRGASCRLAEGEELLIVDGDTRALQGVTRLFNDEGFLVTSLDDGARAAELAAAKFFPVVLLDFQIPNKGGFELLAEFRRISAQTRLIFLTREPNPDQVAEAFRKGAFDVIKKDRAQVPYLKDRVKAACHAFRGGSGGATILLREAKATLEELVTTMVEIAKRNLLLEGTESIVAAGRLNILVVDDSPDLAKILSGKQIFSITHCMTASEALDRLTQYRFDLVIAKEGLPDLPASYVLKQAQGQTTDVMGLRLDEFNGSAGRFTPFAKGKESGNPEVFQTPVVFLKRLESMHERRSEIARERRAVESVTRRNYHLFKRYNEVRERLTNAIDSAERQR